MRQIMSTNTSEKRLIADAIENTVTAQDVVFVAQRVCQDSPVKVLDYQLDVYSKDKLGFLGSYRNLKITVQRKNASTPEVLSLFVKSVPYDCHEQAELISSDGVFIKETSFFETIVPKLQEDYTGTRWAPVCYLAKKDSMIMEDLRARGYALRGRFFDESALLKSALASLARFHACSILAEARMTQLSKHPVTLNEYYPDSFVEILFTRVGKLSQWLSGGIDVVLFVAEYMGYDLGKLRAGFERTYDMVKPSTTYRNVVCHGDLWTNNLMFDDAKPVPNCVLVDYQVIRYAPLALDVAELLYVNTTWDFRRKSEKEMIRFYHSILEVTMKMRNDAIQELQIPTLAEVTTAYEDLRLFGAVVACLYFPITLLDPKIVAECTKDSEAYDNFIFGNRTKVTIGYMKVDEFYKKRIEEAVTELAYICEQL